MQKTHVDEAQLTGWFAGRIPDDWFSGPPEITIDRDEILIVGELPEPEVPEGASPKGIAPGAEGDGPTAPGGAVAARAARIEGFREETRNRRIRIALEAQRRFRRKVSWGAVCGDVTRLFTVLSVPAMTRLRLEERSVLDTLVDAGVARSRSEALAWCVRLVGKNQDEWLGDLRAAFTAVAKVRAEGPQVF